MGATKKLENDLSLDGESEVADPIADDRVKAVQLLELIQNGETPAGIRSQATADLFELLAVYIGLVG